MILYEAEEWGCGRQLESVGQVRLHATRVFLGVGRLHPEVGLQFEMEMLTLKWEAKKCMEVWLKELRMWDSRLIRLVVLQTME